MSAARIAGGIVALLAGLLLGVVVVLGFTRESLVQPEVSVAAASGRGEASPVGAAEALSARSKLLDDRVDAGQTRGVSVDTDGGGRADLVFRDGVAAPRQLTSSWLTIGEKEAPILPEARRIQGISSLPYRNAASFEQPGGRTWRSLHNDQVRYGGSWVIFGVLAALGLFLFVRGRVRITEGKAGTTIKRFSATERANHWMTSSAFVVMALTGLVILYGKPLLLPLIGEAALSDLAWGSAWLHMASAVPFVIGVTMMVVFWLLHNIPTRLDWEWLKRGGGMLRDDGENPPARKFNAGQKIVFWGVSLGGFALLASGLLLMYPFLLFGYDGMQTAQLSHAIISLLMIGLIFGHIYIGTIGMEGAFAAMWSGWVDRNWAKEHHSIWYRQMTGEVESQEPSADAAPGERGT
ncbi:MAG TPA: formate dehydrogenase subunit gamma [Aurantimonas coralicida]|uniref:Formate dehydrogenase subunit gamma n=2 Tax=root TaxID=1 RepID=A0A9C9NGZ3_9HYPH|nr:formate dehydrogenase subunit gamma [Aurantimonas coralicida]HEU01184.1 formate dehydrogenase subunit gamma [Aurantimonas coralicida]